MNNPIIAGRLVRSISHGLLLTALLSGMLPSAVRAEGGHAVLEHADVE